MMHCTYVFHIHCSIYYDIEACIIQLNHYPKNPNFFYYITFIALQLVTVQSRIVQLYLTTTMHIWIWRRAVSLNKALSKCRLTTVRSAAVFTIPLLQITAIFV